MRLLHASVLVLPVTFACGLSSADLRDSAEEGATQGSLSALDAVIVDSRFPATLEPGERAAVSVTVRNTGSTTWTAGADFKLGAVGDEDPLYRSDVRVFLSEGVRVAKGATVRFEFELDAPAAPGRYDTDWQMVQEHVRWFGAAVKRTVEVKSGAGPSPTPPPTPGGEDLVELCRGVTADRSGRQPATAALQACVDRTRAGGTLELPPGTWRMNGQLQLRQPITVRTAGAPPDGSCLAGVACARLQAAPDLEVENGFVVLAGSGVVLDHLVIDGNRAARLGSTSARVCAGGHNRAGFNATAQECVDCGFLHSASINALCGSALEWRGAGASIIGSTFRDNGDNSRHMMWADGLTLLQSDGAVVRNNEFIDNSDIGFISGGARYGHFVHNVVKQSRQLAFGGLMLDNFNGTTHGVFTGAVLAENSVDCTNQQCNYGIVLGPHAWYPSANTRGGEVRGNVVRGAKLGIVASGAGTPDAPLVLFGNDVSGSPSSARFTCGVRQSANLVISPGSVVDTRGESGAARFSVTNCP
ncbi:MAG: hypothetical protein JNJ54_05300 [Myxococcaceae bacterium]|nr:hypothetical protein [Myxococcaceae bacterium]